LIRSHEATLFTRAYPKSPEDARRADELLFRFAERVGDSPEFSEPEVSGIAGTSVTGVFTREVVRQLAERYPKQIDVAWDAYEEPDRLGPVVARALPMAGEDWPVEAHAPFREWIAAAKSAGCTDLEWLLGAVTDDGEFEALQVPITWQIGDANCSRSRMRLPRAELFCHMEPLLKRSDVSIAAELESAPLVVNRVEAGDILDGILDSSAVRYRQLHGFSHPEEDAVFHCELGRGVEIYFFGVPPQWRLPIRAYHAGMFFKNGVPIGYIELLSICEHAEAGFNLYYTFREGETAWVYARLLHLFRQELGIECFSIDPYQIGLENSEAIDSGAFWFYRKLGFRPVDPEVARFTAREEARMRKTPGYRSSPSTLRKLAADAMVYETPAAQKGAWDRFRVRNIGLRNPHARDVIGVREIIEEKQRGSETRYLRLTQQHREVRAALIEMGSR